MACALPLGAAVLVRSSGGALYGLCRTGERFVAIHAGVAEELEPAVDGTSVWTAANRAADPFEEASALRSVARVLSSY